jgi:hypothetical protein
MRLGAVPIRTDAAVTQGELIRQEQEAGLIANSQTPPHASSKALNDDGEDADRTSPQPEEIPHARGPSVVGVEDLGLQDGKGVQMVLSDPNKSQGDDGPEEKDGMDVSLTSSELSNVAVSENAARENSNRNPDDDDDIILDDVAANQINPSTTATTTTIITTTETSTETESEHPITEQNETS